MRLEAKKREVTLLLEGYQTFHAAFGSARAWDEQHITTAGYGPAGLITRGAAYTAPEYTKGEVKRLSESYEYLEAALTMLRGLGPLGGVAHSVLDRAYLGDDADPSRVARWRESKPNTAEWHDYAVAQLAYYLRHTKLYPIEPKRLSESEDKSIENKNLEMYADFQRLRASGLKEREAAQEAAYTASVTVEYVERIIEFKETLRPRTCVEGGCDRPVYSQNLCSRHYQQDLKRRKGRAS